MYGVKLVLVFGTFVVLVGCDLISDKRCNQIECQSHQYCSEIDYLCKPCASICDKAHNYDPSSCEKGCQDYLHDQTYVRKDEQSRGSGYPEDLRAEVEKLHYTLTVTLTLVCIILIGIAIVIIIQIVKWCRNNQITITKLRNRIFHKKSDITASDAKTISNPAARLEGGAKPVELRLDMPPTSGGGGNLRSSGGHSDMATTPNTMSTSISQRRPAEDSTLDYAAYDNPAMRTTSPGVVGGGGGGLGGKGAPSRGGERNY